MQFALAWLWANQIVSTVIAGPRTIEQWDEYGTEAERFIDCGDDVLVVAREHGRGATSGATVSGRIFVVVTFRNGKVLRYREFYDEAAALEAVGLSE